MFIVMLEIRLQYAGSSPYQKLLDQEFSKKKRCQFILKNYLGADEVNYFNAKICCKKIF